MPFSPLETVPVELLADGRLRTLEPFTWTGTRGDTVLVPAGTVTDLASVPWWLRGVIAHDGRIARAAIVHDVLCDQLRTYRGAGRAWEFEHGTRERMNRMVERAQRGQYVVLPSRPAPPAFSAVDADAVFRLILAELEVHPVRRALYWEGVRAGALGSPWRRAGWWRTLPTFLALAPLSLLLLPAALGGLLSGALVGLVGLLVAPFDRGRRRRAGDAVTPSTRTLGARRRRAPLELGPDRPTAEELRAAAEEVRAGKRSLLSFAELSGQACEDTPYTRARMVPVVEEGPGAPIGEL